MVNVITYCAYYIYVIILFMNITPDATASVIVWFIVFPFLAGIIPSMIIRREKRSGQEVCLCGFFLMFAVFEVWALIAMAGGKSLSFLCTGMMISMSLISIAGAVMLAFGLGTRSAGVFFNIPSLKETGLTDNLMRLSFVILLGLQLYMTVVSAAPGKEDAATVEKALTVLYTGRCSGYDASTGLYTGMATEDVLFTYPLFAAMLSSVSALPYETVMYVIMPIFILILMYMILDKTGDILFADERPKKPVFMVIMALIFLFGGYSEYTREFHLLTAPWRATSIAAGLMLPCVLLIMLELSQAIETAGTDDEDNGSRAKISGLYIMLFILNMAALVFGSGSAFTTAAAEGLLIFVVAVRYRKPSGLFLWIPAALPAVLEGIYMIAGGALWQR